MVGGGSQCYLRINYCNFLVFSCHELDAGIGLQLHTGVSVVTNLVGLSFSLLLMYDVL